jgi:hypothetical protein
LCYKEKKIKRKGEKKKKKKLLQRKKLSLFFFGEFLHHGNRIFWGKNDFFFNFQNFGNFWNHKIGGKKRKKKNLVQSL